MAASRSQARVRNALVGVRRRLGMCSMANLVSRIPVDRAGPFRSIRARRRGPTRNAE
jgi:hypothetical protein